MDGMRIIGIDAGGSKTRILAIEEEDQGKSATARLENDILDPCNYRQVGSPGVRTLVKRIIDRFRIDEYRQVFIFGGFAGAATGEDHQAISDVFEEEGFEEKNIFVTSDAELLLMSLKDNGIVLVAGTGSICLGRSRSVSDQRKMVEARAGGYGNLVSSEPGGYYLGKQAIDAALRIEDGREQEQTALYKSVKQHFEVEKLHRIQCLLHTAGERMWKVRKKVAGLSSSVLREAHNGDGVAARFVREMVDELANHVRAVSNAMNIQKSIVGLHGGLFSDRYGEELIMDPLKRHENLEEFDFEFETLGIKEGDRDPLVEAIRFYRDTQR
jgi:N-acetylglucosamine kinase-like BadF-type ATPase